MLSLITNAYLSEIILIPASDMEVSSDDPRIALDSHASMVVLRSNSFVFETTGRTCNVQPFISELGMAKKSHVVDGALVC